VKIHAHHSNLHKKCAGKKDLNFLHITEIYITNGLAIRKTQISSSQKLYTFTGKGYFVRNYQLLDKKYTIGMEFCLELPELGHRNPLEE
jgi:hypothetical protein